MRLLSPAEAISRQQWACLTEAADDAETGRIVSTLEKYRQVVPNLIVDGRLRWSNIEAEPEYPSRNGVCRLLRAYYTLTQMWPGWSFLVQPVLEPEILQTLLTFERARLISAHGWATIRRLPLPVVIARQEQALAACANPADAAHHHLMLCHAYTLAFEYARSLDHGRRAEAEFSATGSVWDQMRMDEILGTAYYTASKYDEALACYAHLEERIASIGAEAEPMRPFYALGWATLGQKDFVRAQAYFQSAYLQKINAGLVYDAGRSRYAEGYARFQEKDYSGARQCQEEALSIFCDNDHNVLNQHNFGQGSRSTIMIATCLHQIALIAERTHRFREAYMHERRAVAHQRDLDDPGQLADFLRRAPYHAALSGHLTHVLGYLREYIQLRLRHRVPGFRL